MAGMHCGAVWNIALTAVPCCPCRTLQHLRRIHHHPLGAHQDVGLAATIAHLLQPGHPAHPPAPLRDPALLRACCGPPGSLPSVNRRKAAPWRSVPELVVVLGNTCMARPGPGVEG